MRSLRVRQTGSVLAGVAALMISVGCGEDSVLGSSNRGSGSDTQTTTVENAYIVPEFLPGRCAIQLNTGADLRFTVTNNRSTEAERLLGVSTTEAEKARIITAVEIPPESTVAFGEPSAQSVDVGGRVPAVRLDQLDPDLRPAMSAGVTFQFQRARDITMLVPVEACPVQ